MKVLKKVILIFVFSTILLISTVFAETGTVNVSATRLREKSNTDSDILTNIYKNDKVEILGEDGDWYQVKYDGKTGYVKKEYVTLDKKQENTNTTNEASGNNTTNEASNNNAETHNNQATSLINLRNIPSMISRVVTQIELSTNVITLNEMGSWVQVTNGTYTGWTLKEKMVSQETNTNKDVSNTVSENVVSNTAVNNTTNTTKNTNTNTQTNTSKTTNTTNTANTSKNSEETAINKTGTVNVETAKVRQSASSTAKVTDFLDYDDKVTIVAEDGDWYKITSPKSGYVNKKLITISDDNLTSRSLSEERKEVEDDTTVNQEANASLSQAFNNSTNGNQVAEYAKQYIGYSYVAGGKTPKSGFDCSGFTQYIYSNFGYNLGNTASTQTSVGTEISRDNLQVGDLLLFYNEGKTSIGHTGIYIGNGEFVHAANPDRGVVTDNINTNSYYNERFESARRIVE